MKRLLPILFMLSVLTLSARKVKTGPTQLVPEKTVANVVFDTIIPPDNSVIFSGYDKPNNATKETFLVTNLLPDSVEISALNVTFTYTDLNGRMLHSATHTIRTSIPPGQTRSLFVPSWDKNHAFHYFRSQPPSRRQSSPFKVVSSLNFVVILPR